MITPTEYLYIDLANHFGLDKLTFDKRIAWVKAIRPWLRDWAKDAEEPELFTACLNAIEQAERDEPITYCISLDATASGLQILAALTGCRKTAELTNLIPNGKRMDIYTYLYEQMNLPSLQREKVKKAVMTAFYGSLSIPKSLFNKKELTVFYQTLKEYCPWPWQLNQYLLDNWNPTVSFYHWLMPDCHTVHIPVTNMEYHKISFVNQQLTVPVAINAPNKYGRSLSANLVHSVDGFVVREMIRRCNYTPANVALVRELLQEPNNHSNKLQLDALGIVKVLDQYKATGILSAAIIDLLAEYPEGYSLLDAQAKKDLLVLLDSLPTKPFHILPIHDCFKCHPNYGNDLRNQYKHILSDLAKSNLLQHILSQMLGDDVEASVEEDLSQDILQSEYALC